MLKRSSCAIEVTKKDIKYIQQGDEVFFNSREEGETNARKILNKYIRREKFFLIVREMEKQMLEKYETSFIKEGEKSTGKAGKWRNLKYR